MSSFLPLLRPFVDPWYESLLKPQESQDLVAKKLSEIYVDTEYGKGHSASTIEGLDDFRKLFPIVTYSDLRPYLEKVKQGNFQVLLSEPVVRWVMTRGTTGVPKLIPATKTHLSQILSVGARAIINLALKKNELELLNGNVLNLNFPSEVNLFVTPEGSQPYGYSSGTYAKFNPSLATASLVPKQEEIDSLGGGIEKKDWEARFELVYEKAREKEILSVMGVTPVILSFARHIKRRHGIYPKDLWKMKGLFPTSVAKIQTRYAPLLQMVYGNVPVVEMYTATEGVLAQQLDKNPYVCPNYDTYLFEVRTRGNKVKMLHELERGEWGSLIVSSVLFARYEIGDYIESMGRGYFRVLGRAKALTALEHMLFQVVALRF